MTDPDAQQRALDTAARLLSQRDHARAELVARLARGGDAATAVRTVERLTAAGLVDDGRFAAALAANRLRRGLGPARIAHDLERAGVARDLIGETIAALDPADLDAAARRAVGQRTGAAAIRRLAACGFDPDADG